MMPSFLFCCICAAARGTGANFVDDKSEKTIRDLDLSCCGRAICARCIVTNARWATYCPFCQKLRLEHEPSSSGASNSLPPPYSFDDPIAFEQAPSRTQLHPSPSAFAEPMDILPSYAAHQAAITPVPLPTASATLEYSPAQISGCHEDREPVDVSQSESVTHYLHPTDTLPSLSLAYEVPISTIRAHNQLHSDHLLSARRKIKIPRSHYTGASLSPQPVEGEEESERKARLRRFMVKCKCHDYKVAGLYLEDHDWNLDKAIEKWWADERWEKENPMPKGTSGGLGFR